MSNLEISFVNPAEEAPSKALSFTHFKVRITWEQWILNSIFDNGVTDKELHCHLNVFR